MSAGNEYCLQNVDDNDYTESTRERVNDLVERGLAIWIGTDYDEDRNVFVHYADRVE